MAHPPSSCMEAHLEMQETNVEIERETTPLKRQGTSETKTRQPGFPHPDYKKERKQNTHIKEKKKERKRRKEEKTQRTYKYLVKGKP